MIHLAGQYLKKRRVRAAHGRARAAKPYKRIKLNTTSHFRHSSFCDNIFYLHP